MVQVFVFNSSRVDTDGCLFFLRVAPGAIDIQLLRSSGILQGVYIPRDCVRSSGAQLGLCIPRAFSELGA